MSFKGLKGIQQNEEEVMKHLQLKEGFDKVAF